jgi:hypothetical protein
MEQNQSALFGLGIDQTSKAHLADAAKWARFLAIVGFVFCGLMVVFSIFFGSFFSMLPGSASNSDMDADFAQGLAIGMIIYYLIIATIVFIGYLFLYRFATHMRRALATNDQNVLNTSFQNLKITFRYVGILTIIGLVLMALGILSGIAGMTMGG